MLLMFNEHFQILILIIPNPKHIWAPAFGLKVGWLERY